MGRLNNVRTDALESIGRSLHRPECVLCTSDGTVYVSDWDGGVCQIAANGEQRRILHSDTSLEIRPNGISLTRHGTILLANLGDLGGVWELSGNGDIRPFVTEIAASPLPPTNFVLSDAEDRTWISVSTTVRPRADAYRASVRDGYIAVADRRGARIVAEGLGYANEVQVHPSGNWLYVNETFARRTSRFRIAGNGSLGRRQTVVEYGPGTFPDGLCFDEDGGFWTVSIVSNRVIRVDADGKQRIVLEDSDAAFLQHVENAFQNGEMGRPHLDNIVSKRLKSTSSIAFGGPDRRLSYLGCLLGDHIVSFRSPIAGIEPAHWNWQMK